MSRKIALAALALSLIFVNWSIFQKEQHLAQGRTVFLELAPVDPRSLMQGDYMALRFRLADEVYQALSEQQAAGRRRPLQVGDGYAVVSLNKRSVGSFARLHAGQSLSEEEVLIRYRVRHSAVKLATNAFFFQEGQGAYYEPARYGMFRVDGKGELLLVAMYDKELKLLGPKADQIP